MIKNKTLIIGYGVQGKKRSKFLKSNSFITLDKESKSDFSELNKVPLRSYKNVFICMKLQKIKLSISALKIIKIF